MLTLTAQGEILERQLSESQRRLMATAFRDAGAEAVEGFRKVLLGMINDQDRQALSRAAPPQR